MSPRRPRVLTWAVHGSYLRYLAAADADLLIPVERSDELAGYPDNVIGVPSDRLDTLDVDLVLYQSVIHWRDRERLLPARLLTAPAAYVEHDPPREHPTDTRHPAADEDVLLVHVTHYNALMWDAGRTPTTVVEHGVPDPGVRYDGSLARGIVVINDIGTRGRRLGRDLFEQLRERVPLDLVGMQAEAVGGLGEVKLPDLPAFVARYRFFFTPIRYTSLGLAILEAMAVGVPVVGLATTELPRAIRDGESGYLSNDPDELVARMEALLADHDLARRIGAAGRAVAASSYGIGRFAADWEHVFDAVRGRALPARASGARADELGAVRS